MCWMTGLADDTPVTCLSIPGAHDAASSTITAFKRWTRTQELNVAELWNCGVRAFDLRPAWVDGEMGLYHDKYSAHVSFPAVMRSLVLALERHPGEGAIVLIRHEEEADGNSPEWAAEMGKCLQELRPHLASWHPGMTLADLRGKILVLSRNRYDGGPMGAYIEGWTSGTDAGAQRGATLVDASGSRSPVWVQDYYKPAGADDKWTEIRDLLDAASTAADPSPQSPGGQPRLRIHRKASRLPRQRTERQRESGGVYKVDERSCRHRDDGLRGGVHVGWKESIGEGIG